MENIIDNKYEILSKIGSGATSNVYKARRLSDDFIVAVKVVRDDVDDVDEQEKAFRHEAEALSKLSHRNVRRILAAGRWNGLLYMVTEYINGSSLKGVIEQEGPISQKKAVDYALQIAAGIEHAHLKNIIHRDIKSQNVLVSLDGTVKLVDFGIARVVSQKTRTMGGRDIVGSVHYISPEQARGTVVDSRTDIYSFGVVLYEMFTGHVPFEGGEAVAIAMKHVSAEPIEPKVLNPEITDGINDIILKCMQKDPAKRYQTASELREDLLLYVANPDGFTVINRGEKKQYKEEYEADNEVTPVRRRAVEEPVKRRHAEEKQVTEQRKERKEKNKNGKLIGAILGGVAAFVLIVVLIISLLPKKQYDNAIVPTVTNLSRTAAITMLKNSNFYKYDVLETNSGTIAVGNVVKTEPAIGEEVPVNTLIKIYISTGPAMVMPENTIGKTVDEATQILENQGFKVAVSYVSQSGVEGTVADQSELGKEIREGTTITITVIKHVVKVPNLIGLSLDEATAKISSAGFTLGEVREQKTENKNQTGVIWQSVEGDKELPYPLSAENKIIDIAIAVYGQDYICVYEYSVPDEYMGKNLELLITDSNNVQKEYKFENISEDKIAYEYESSLSKSELVVFELYYNNQVVDKKTIETFSAAE